MEQDKVHDPKKRKGSDLTSELDSSVNSPSKTEAAKPRKKKSKGNSEQQGAEEKKETPEINRQLADINKKLSNVITRDDGFLRGLIREIFHEMKDELLNSVSHRIELLEGTIFDNNEENDKLKTEIKHLNEELENQKAENEKLVEQIKTVNDAAEDRINDLEQYGRRNNLRINGIPEDTDVEETAERTTRKVAETLNRVIVDLNLAKCDFDIAHRLGQRGPGSCRPVIVKFQSRMKRDIVLRNRKLFKGSNIYMNEDLTRLNQLVLSCVRKKMPDEVDKVWVRNGRISYKNKAKHVHEVKFSEYEDWIDLEWPEPTDSS